VKKFQEQTNKWSRSKQSIKKRIERVLSSGKYLVKRDREEVISFGEAGALGPRTILIMP
jgi:hypothetical protein